ncbi:MAG: peptide chain release factor 1 [Firmicutes bacterium]|nr:peptide chain release factor 1 [Candidatus Colimorpha enterica]
MLEKIREAARYYEAINAELSGPAASDPVKLSKLLKEQRRLEPIISKYTEYAETEKRLADAEALLSDREMKDMAAEEVGYCRRRCDELYRELQLLLIPKDPDDDKNVVVEIRAGVGGEEAALFSYDLYRMYSMYCAQNGFKLSVVNSNETELGGYKEISFIIEGDGAYSRMKYESGVHRVQRVPDTESQGRIHTSTVTVAVLPEAEEVEINIDQNDLEIDTMKSSGAGGQHINKTESAVRILHKPSGLIVECRDERSQLKNKDKAMKVLRSRLYELERSKAEGEMSSKRRTQIGSGDRSEKIRTYNFPQSRMTDHRIGFTSYSLDNFMNGAIGELINALTAADNAEKLKSEIGD